MTTEEIKAYIQDRIQSLSDSLIETKKIAGSNCIVYTYDYGAREELLDLLEMINDKERTKCNHEWDYSEVLTSNPPRHKCMLCGEFSARKNLIHMNDAIKYKKG